MQIYVVQPGDNVNTIANRFGVTVDSVIYNNQLESPYRLAVGQALLISAGPQNQEKRNLRTNGFAYPDISPWVLSQTLPYLTDLSVFSYGFYPNGDLIPPALDETWMIESARSQKTNPILVLAPLGPNGRFNNQLIHQLFQNPGASNRLILQVGLTMQEKAYAGLNIDFEYVLAEDRDAFTAFVAAATSALNPLGFTVSVDLAPKTSANQEGVLYEGKDYRGLGQAANSVLLMTYEWGYTYGPPMAVAPISSVRRVVEYAVTEIPREKIDLGIPNYGYDWPLPFERGVTRAQTIGNVEAVQVAIRQGVSIQFDTEAMSPFFRYWQAGVQHEVWFEDVRSLQAKFSLIKEFGLRGAGYWQIMQLFRANWLLLADTFWITKNGA